VPDEDREAIPWRLKALEEDMKEIKSEKASHELVDFLIQQMGDLKEDFRALKRILLTTALGWVAGSGLFLVAVLELGK
jgi:hypothetical protein